MHCHELPGTFRVREREESYFGGTIHRRATLQLDFTFSLSLLSFTCKFSCTHISLSLFLILGSPNSGIVWAPLGKLLGSMKAQ